MTRRRVERAHGCRRWPWWKRALWVLFKFVFGPWLTKHEDGTLGLAWTPIIATVVLAVVTLRFLPLRGEWVFAPIGWPEAFLVVLTLYVKPINDALNAYAKKNPEGLVNALLARMGAGDVATGTDLGFTGPANDGAPGGDWI